MVVVIAMGLWVWWLWVEERETWCYGGGRDCFGVVGVVAFFFFFFFVCGETGVVALG